MFIESKWKAKFVILEGLKESPWIIHYSVKFFLI